MSYENRAGLDGVVYELLVYEAINRVLNSNDFREAFAGDHSCDPSEVKPSVAFQKGIVLPASIPGKTDEVWRSDCAVTLSIPSKVYDHVFAIQYHWFERNSHIPFWKKMSELARLKIKRPELIVTSVLMGINRWKTGELRGFRETFDNHIEAFLPSIETYGLLIEIARQSNLRRGIKDIEEANDFFVKLRSAEQNPQLNEYIRTLQDKLRNLLLGSAENVDLIPVWDTMRAYVDRTSSLVNRARKLRAGGLVSQFLLFQLDPDEIKERFRTPRSEGPFQVAHFLAPEDEAVRERIQGDAFATLRLFLKI